MFMPRSLCIALLVALVCMSSGVICFACSIEEGCLMFSELVPDSDHHLDYDVEIIDVARLVSFPGSVFETFANSTSYPSPQVSRSCDGLFGWGVTKGSQWWLISLGVKDFETEEVDIPYGYTVPPYCSVSASKGYKQQDRAINIKCYQLYRCNEHKQYWRHYYYEGLAFDRVFWTDVSIEIESLGPESPTH